LRGICGRLVGSFLRGHGLVSGGFCGLLCRFLGGRGFFGLLRLLV
jgi:hypothetical protein